MPRAYILNLSLGEGVIPINNRPYLCQDPSELQRLMSNGNQPELSSLTSSPPLSKRPAAEGVAGEWQLLGNTTWNMLAACQGTLPWGVGWGKHHHSPFSWTSLSLWSNWSSSLLPPPDISSCRYVPEAFTLLYALALSLSCAHLFFLLSLLSTSSLGIRSQADLKTGAMY